jgi:hypothetical protein
LVLVDGGLTAAGPEPEARECGAVAWISGRTLVAAEPAEAAATGAGVVAVVAAEAVVAAAVVRPPTASARVSAAPDRERIMRTEYSSNQGESGVPVLCGYARAPSEALRPVGPLWAG